MAPDERIEIALLQIDDWVGEQGVPGVAASVWRRGQLAAQRFAGEAQAGIAVDETTLFALASVTKPVSAAVVMATVANGNLSLDDSVVQQVEEFATASNPGRYDAFRRDVTIRQLLCHTSGLPEDLPRGAFRGRDAPSLSELTDAMCELPLGYQPGTRMLYSNSGYGVLARIVERMTDERFWDAAWRVVIEPLRMRQTVDRPGPGLAGRIAIVRDAANSNRETEAYNSQYWRNLGIPWGGLYGTAADMAAFAGAFLAGSDAIMAPELMKEMVTDQLHGIPGSVQSLRVHWPEAAWGLGWEVKGNKRRHWTGELTSPATFCHFGATGTLLWADPERDVALAVFANRTTYSLWPFEPPRWARLSNSVINAVS